MIWCNLENLIECKDVAVKQIVSNSDHFPVQVALRADQEISIPKQKYLWKDEGLISFQRNLDNLLNFNTDFSLNKANEHFMNCLHKSAVNTGMFVNINFKNTNYIPWSDSQSREAKKNLNKDLKECKKIISNTSF